jgi:signal peptidase II
VGGDTAREAMPDEARGPHTRPATAARIADPAAQSMRESVVDSDGVDSGIVTETDGDGTSASETDASAPHGSRRRAVVVLVAVSILAVVADIITKQLVITHLRPGVPVRVIGGLLYFNPTRNGGAAFSMGTGVTWVFPTIALVVLGAICYLSLRLRSVAWAIALGLVVGGAIGNLIDRLFRAPGPFRGEVVDFISLFSGTGRGFAIFNFADSCLTIGVFLAVILELSGRHRDGSRART